MVAPRCPHCGMIAFLEMQECPNCRSSIGYHYPSRAFVSGDPEGAIVDGTRWVRCANWSWQCNWLVSVDDEAGSCFACRLTRRRPESDDTIALEKLAETAVDLRRLLVQLLGLGLPVLLTAATHLISSRSALIVFSALTLAVSAIAVRLQAAALRR